MKRLLLALCLVPSLSFAQAYGCFIEPGDYYCSQRTINCQSSSVRNIEWFGYTTGDVCNSFVYCVSQLTDMTTARDVNSTGWDSCIDQYNALVKPYNKNLTLIKKLRAACGAKCKRIK